MGMGPVMIDLHWNSEDVSAKWEMSQRTCHSFALGAPSVWPCTTNFGGVGYKKKETLHHSFNCICQEKEKNFFFLSARGMLKMCAIFRVMLMANNGAKQSLLLPFFFLPLPRNKSRRTYCMSALYLRTCVRAAASRARRRGCRLSGGVSACSVTTTPGVRLITEGSKGHELHSGGGSLRGPLRSDSSSNLKGHI